MTNQSINNSANNKLIVDEKALAAVMKDWHDKHGVWKDMTIRSIVEAYIEHTNKGTNNEPI